MADSGKADRPVYHQPADRPKRCDGASHHQPRLRGIRSLRDLLRSAGRAGKGAAVPVYLAVPVCFCDHARGLFAQPGNGGKRGLDCVLRDRICDGRGGVSDLQEVWGEWQPVT